MKTKVHPYELFQDSLPHLLAYVIGKAASGDQSAIKAAQDWERTCPKAELVIDVDMVMVSDHAGLTGTITQEPPYTGDDEHAH